jgi:hypothetical protein
MERVFMVFELLSEQPEAEVDQYRRSDAVYNTSTVWHMSEAFYSAGRSGRVAAGMPHGGGDDLRGVFDTGVTD